MLFETKVTLQPVDNNLVRSLIIIVDRNKCFKITSALCLNNMLVCMVIKFWNSQEPT